MKRRLRLKKGQKDDYMFGQHALGMKGEDKAVLDELKMVEDLANEVVEEDI
jgi:hypothetical protein